MDRTHHRSGHIPTTGGSHTSRDSPQLPDREEKERLQGWTPMSPQQPARGSPLATCPNGSSELMGWPCHFLGRDTSPGALLAGGWPTMELPASP